MVYYMCAFVTKTDTLLLLVFRKAATILVKLIIIQQVSISC